MVQICSLHDTFNSWIVWKCSYPMSSSGHASTTHVWCSRTRLSWFMSKKCNRKKISPFYGLRIQVLLYTRLESALDSEIPITPKKIIISRTYRPNSTTIYLLISIHCQLVQRPRIFRDSKEHLRSAASDCHESRGATWQIKFRDSEVLGCPN